MDQCSYLSPNQYQNLYYSKDPTQRRNCQYLVLFNNPVDKQQIMTLGSQMYPGKVSYFLQKCEEATTRDYGHLLLVFSFPFHRFAFRTPRLNMSP
jgi:hypothetical protein